MDYLRLCDLQELKAFRQPPQGVKLVMFAVLALFGEEESWPNAKKFLGNRSVLIRKITSLDIDSISLARARRVESYMMNPLLTPEYVQKSSRAAYVLFEWLKFVYQEYVDTHALTPSKIKKKVKRKKSVRTRPVEIPVVFQREGRLSQQTTDPVIVGAIHGLQSLTKRALSEMRTYHHPPDVVKQVSFAVLSIFGEATTWPNAQHFFGKHNLMSTFLSFDINRITPARAKRVRYFMNNELLQQHVIRKTSAAALCLWEWVEAVYKKYLAGKQNMEAEVKTKKTRRSARVTSRSMTSVTRRNTAPFPLASRSVGSLPSNNRNAKVPTKSNRVKVGKNRIVTKVSTPAFHTCCPPLTIDTLMELKSYSNPPEVVKHVCFAMLALFGEDTTWINAVQFLNRNDLIHKVNSFDLRSITSSRAKRVRAYVDNDVLTRELIQKTSLSALKLWEWVVAVYSVYKMSNPLGNKRVKLRRKINKRSVHSGPDAAAHRLSADEVCRGLHSLAKDAIFELRSFQNPPEIVKLVCFAMLALFGEDTSWLHAVQFLNKKDFINKLLAFDVHSITRRRANRVRAYVNNDVMTSDAIGRTSKAALCLWDWVCAVYNIYKMNRQRSIHSF
jgi:hypothetical protein